MQQDDDGLSNWTRPLRSCIHTDRLYHKVSDCRRQAPEMRHGISNCTRPLRTTIHTDRKLDKVHLRHQRPPEMQQDDMG